MIRSAQVPWLRPEQIEHAVTELRKNYRKHRNREVRPPVPIDDIVEFHLGLDFILGTAKANNADAARKGRTARGERRWNAALSDDGVVALRRMHACGATCAEMASAMNVSKNTAHRAATARSWRHVEVSS